MMKGGWRNLHNEELHDLCSLPGIIRIIKLKRMRWQGIWCKWGRRGMRIGYWSKSQRERPLGRPKCRRVDTVKMDLVETGWGGVGWIGLAQDRDKWRGLVNAVMNLGFYKMLGNY
jgi:hypothetical protein